MTATAPRLAGDSGQLRLARGSLIVVFVLHAAVFASWTPHIPDIRHDLGLSEARLGLALAGEPIGSMGVLLVAGAIVARYGSSQILRWGVRALAVATAVVGLADTFAALFLVLCLWGAVLGTLNIAMNTQALTIERLHRRPILAGFHAAWSLGGFAGAALGSFGDSTAVPLWLQLGLTAGAAMLITELTSRWYLSHGHEERSSGPRFVRPTGPLVRLSLIAVCGFTCEGTAAIWAAVYLQEVVAVRAGLAGAGYAAYALAMFVGRVVGDPVAARVEPVLLMRLLATIAGLGFLLALLVPSLVSAVVGFALLGLGLSGLMPIVLRTVGRLPDQPTAPSVAAISTAGWLGLVGGPPLVGFLATCLTLSLALGLVVVLSAVVFSLAPAVRRAEVAA